MYSVGVSNHCGVDLNFLDMSEGFAHKSGIEEWDNVAETIQEHLSDSETLGNDSGRGQPSQPLLEEGFEVPER